MLKKLRRRFILINMTTVGLIIVCIFAATCVNTFIGSREEILRSLHQTSVSERVNEPHHQIGAGKSPADDQRLIACVTVVLDDAVNPTAYESVTDINAMPNDLARSNGEIKRVDEQNATIDRNVLETAVDTVLQNGKMEGTLDLLGLIFVCSRSPDGTKISFADSSAVWSKTKETVLNCMFLGTLSLCALFADSFWLSGVVVQPAKRAWTQQQQFVSDASHELKTPLTVILANSDILALLRFISHRGEPQMDTEHQRGSGQNERIDRASAVSCQIG